MEVFTRNEIIRLVKAGQWTDDLFDAVAHECLRNNAPCIFTVFRRVMTPKQYELFDLKYSIHGRPQDKPLLLYIYAEKKKERDDEEWKKARKIELLKRKKESLEAMKANSEK